MARSAWLNPLLTRLILTTLVLMSLIFAEGTAAVSGNGITKPVASGTAGPYEYTVGIWPHSPALGLLHLSIVLLADQQPLSDATVNVILHPEGQPDSAETIRARNHILSPQSYELNANLDSPGRWVVTIDISSPLGSERIDVPLEVEENGTPASIPTIPDGEQQPGQGINWLAAAIPLAIVLLVLGAVGLRRLRESRK